MFAGPASFSEWLLAAAGAAVFLVFIIGLRALNASAPRTRQSAFRYEMAFACGLIHAVGILSRRAPGPGWTMAGILLYGLAIVLFLDGIERMPHPLTPPSLALPVSSAQRHRGAGPAWRRIDLAFIIAWASGPLATHSPTLTVTAAIMIAMQLSANRLR